jgi:hypothetical protein
VYLTLALGIHWFPADITLTFSRDDPEHVAPAAKAKSEATCPVDPRIFTPGEYEPPVNRTEPGTPLS